MRKIAVTCGFLLLSIFGFSQQDGAYSFTLTEAINFAIDSSYTAINARRDIAKAIKKKWETTAIGFPQINSDISYLNNLKQPVTLIPAEITGGTSGTFVPVTFGTKQNASITATLDQLIFDGSYLVGLKAARVFLNYSENASEKINLEIRKGVINAYGSVLLSEELIEIYTKNKINLEKNLLEARKVYENGLIEEENVEQLEITLLEIVSQLNNAQRSAIIAKQMFNLALGIDVDASVRFEDTLDSLVKENINLSFLDPSLIMEQNVDYKIAFNLTEQRSLELKLEKSRALPRLTAFLNYGTSANNDTFSFFRNEQRWFQSSILGFNMTIPIFSSGLRNANTQRAKIALSQAETQLEETIQNVKLELNAAKSNYQFAIENYENSKKNFSLAERIENKNQIKFTEGISSSFDLRQAQTQLYSAQQYYFQAMLEVINSKAILETVLNSSQLINSNN